MWIYDKSLDPLSLVESRASSPSSRWGGSVRWPHPRTHGAQRWYWKGKETKPGRTLAASGTKGVIFERIVWLMLSCFLGKDVSRPPFFGLIKTCRHVVYTYIHTYMHTDRQTYIHTSMHTYIHAYIHTCRQTDRQTYRHTYMHAQCKIFTFDRFTRT